MSSRTVHFGSVLLAGSVPRRHRFNEKSGARASGGVGVISRMPGEGDVTALPLFRQGAGDSSLLSDSSPVLVVLYNKVFLVCV